MIKHITQMRFGSASCAKGTHVRTRRLAPAQSMLQQLSHCLATHGWPHLQLEDAFLDGAGDDEARHVDGLELAQAVDSVLRLLLDRRVPPACTPLAEGMLQDGAPSAGRILRVS